MTRQPNIQEIYGKYSTPLYFTALRITGNSFEAEEVMHDTILKYHSFHPKESIEKLGSWLTSVCIRKSLDKLREKHRNQDFLEEYKEWQETESSSPPENCNIEGSLYSAAPIASCT